MKKKIGILGGSFDPPHKGHRWAVSTCLNQLKLHFLYVIPSYQTPCKTSSHTPPEKRLEILAKTLKDIPQAEILDIEMKRKGVSYTVDTLNQLSLDTDEVYLIIGEDLLFQFHTWKNFEQIIQKVNLIVLFHTDLKKKNNWPVVFRKYLNKWDKNTGSFHTGRKVHLIKNDSPFRDISSTQIRNRLRLALPVSDLLHPSVFSLVKKHYKHLQNKSQIFEDIIRFLKEKGALNPQFFQFREKIYESILVASGLNTRHVRSLSSEVQNYIYKMYGISPQHIEGNSLSQWIVLDYDFLIIHIFYDYLRQYYQLEDLWQKHSFKNR